MFAALTLKGTTTHGEENFSLTIPFLLIGIALNVQAQVGDRFQTRDPKTCDSKQEPTSGPITAAHAQKYLICNLESDSGEKLYLLENVSVQVGKGTP